MARRAKCGTESGRRAHYGRDEAPCKPCILASRTAQAERDARRSLADPYNSKVRTHTDTGPMDVSDAVDAIGEILWG
jgi:hypothetical protein